MVRRSEPNNRTATLQDPQVQPLLVVQRYQANSDHHGLKSLMAPDFSLLADKSRVVRRTQYLDAYPPNTPNQFSTFRQERPMQNQGGDSKIETKKAS